MATFRCIRASEWNSLRRIHSWNSFEETWFAEKYSAKWSRSVIGNHRYLIYYCFHHPTIFLEILRIKSHSPHTMRKLFFLFIEKKTILFIIRRVRPFLWLIVGPKTWMIEIDVKCVRFDMLSFYVFLSSVWLNSHTLWCYSIQCSHYNHKPPTRKTIYLHKIWTFFLAFANFGVVKSSFGCSFQCCFFSHRIPTFKQILDISISFVIS